jgi:predicted pyridoxine 5'-phosphate oxidase superfamily flavin-nucleotide-binding protein
MNDRVHTIADLEAIVGAAPMAVKMKIIDHLDATAKRWIGAAPLAFVGFGTDDGPRVTAAGGPAGFAGVGADGVLRIPLSALDDAGGIEAGRGAGVLFLIPGVGETLRANGRVAGVDDTAVEIAVEECFVHCAKALIRSDFWTSAGAPAPTDPAAFVNATRFLALATMDAEGRIDVSPKGDPAGLLIRLDGERASLAERPGNRLAFGYRNMIEQPRVAVLGVIPGVTATVGFPGVAHLTSDETIRAGFVVEDKMPIMATVIDGVRPAIRRAGALERAALWPAGPAPQGIDAATTLVAHLKLNKERGPAAALLRLAATRGIVQKGLASNYRTDLY